MPKKKMYLSKSFHTLYAQMKSVTVTQVIAYLIVVFAIGVILRIIWDTSTEPFLTQRVAPNGSARASSQNARTLPQCQPNLYVSDSSNKSCAMNEIRGGPKCQYNFNAPASFDSQITIVAPAPTTDTATTASTFPPTTTTTYATPPGVLSAMQQIEFCKSSGDTNCPTLRTVWKEYNDVINKNVSDLQTNVDKINATVHQNTQSVAAAKQSISDAIAKSNNAQSVSSASHALLGGINSNLQSQNACTKEVVALNGQIKQLQSELSAETHKYTVANTNYQNELEKNITILKNQATCAAGTASRASLGTPSTPAVTTTPQESFQNNSRRHSGFVQSVFNNTFFHAL